MMTLTFVKLKSSKRDVSQCEKEPMYFIWDSRAHVMVRQHHNSATRVREGSRSLCQQNV